MSSESLWQNIFRRRSETSDLPTVLGQVPIFADLNRRERNLVSTMLHIRRYEPEEVVFMQGQPGTGMYILLSGKVNISLHYKQEDQIDLATLQTGDFFGELSLLDESPRSATAVTEGATELAGFFRPDLMDLLEQNPSLGIKVVLSLAEVLGERLRSTNAELQGLRSQLLLLRKTTDSSPEEPV